MANSTTHPSQQLITIGAEDDDCPKSVPKAATPTEPEGKRTRPKRFNARRMAPLKKRRRAKSGRGHRRRRWRR